MNEGVQSNPNKDVHENRSKWHSSFEVLESMTKYRVERERIKPSDIGTSKRGGSAEVELAILLPQNFPECSSLESPQNVALKKLKIGDDTNQDRVLRLLARELGLLSKLSHKNIVEFIGFVEDVSRGIAWMIFPWEANGNIREFLQSGDWEIPERISLIHDVACGIQYLHGHQPPICHGDLKSPNILVNSQHRAVLTDFGSARLLDHSSESSAGDHVKVPNLLRNGDQGEGDQSPRIDLSITDSVITFTGPAWTLRWAAPEVLDGELPGLPSDIWAFGWICWEVMTDTYPFADVKQDAAVVLRVVTGDLPSIGNNTHVSQIQALCSLVLECWSLDPYRRPAAKKCMTNTNWMTRIVPSRNTARDGKTSQPADLLRSIGQLHVQHGRLQAGIEKTQQALSISRSTDDQNGEAEAHCILSEAYYRIGDFHKSETACKEALAIYSILGNEGGVARSLSLQTKVSYRNGDYSNAKSCMLQVQDIYTRLDNDLGSANALYDVGYISLAEHQYEEAASALSEAHRIYTSLGVDLGIANAVSGLAWLRFIAKDYIKAASLYLEAQEIFERIGDKTCLANTLEDRAEVLVQEERYMDALALLHDASRTYQDLGAENNVSRCDTRITTLKEIVEARGGH